MKKSVFGTKWVGIGRNQEISMQIDAPRSGDLENRGFGKTNPKFPMKNYGFSVLGWIFWDNHDLGKPCFFALTTRGRTRMYGPPNKKKGDQRQRPRQPRHRHNGSGDGQRSAKSERNAARAKCDSAGMFCPKTF